MDSINSVGPIEQWEDAVAPGADDDGSGSTVVMEVLNVLLNSGFQGERSLEFQWYAGEERGLLGSRILAETYHREHKEVFAMLQIDMCAGGGPLKFIMDYVDVGLSSFEHQLVDEYLEVRHAQSLVVVNDILLFQSLSPLCARKTGWLC
jgi:leucyl aminopeptidase